MKQEATSEEKERVAILVDGSNFYHYVKGLGLTGQLGFDYGGFAEWLARGRQVVSATYYIGKIRTDGSGKSMELRRNQQRLTSGLRNVGWEVEYGHMLKNKGGYQEKGVDVHLAVDLVIGTFKDQYDTGILVSSDTDLIPAVRAVREEGKKVEYVGFSGRPSFALVKESNRQTMLQKDDVVQFLP